MLPDFDQPLRYPGQKFVRAGGVLLLVACIVMVVLGLTVLAKHLHGPQFVLYWSWCFLLVLATFLAALLDLALVARASRHTRRQLYREQFMSPDMIGRLRNRKKPDQKSCPPAE